MRKLPPGRVVIPGLVYSGKGVGAPIGVDSYSHPLYMSELSLRWLVNAVTQGAFVQTRPGFRTAMTFDTTAQGSAANEWWQANEGPVVHAQMCVPFTPTTGQQQLVFAVSGTLFFCSVNADGTLLPPQEIPGIRLNQNADQVVACACTQSATIIAGKYANNITPRNLLVIQDGVSRATIWDGNVAVQMNPAKRIQVTSDDSTLYPEDWNQTRIGLWMAWSGNRLWVALGQNVYASDLYDPTHFTEELRLNSVPFFTFPGEVTGLADRGTSGTNRSQVVAFTASTTWTLWSGLQARFPSNNPPAQGWAYTADFMTKIFGGVGCVAGKSVVLHRGLLYWKSEDGLVMFDSTATVNSTQNLPPIDQEMALSKMRVSPSAEGMDLTCAGRFNNYVFWGVPVGYAINGRCYNSQTQVLDRQTTTVRSTGTGGAFQAGTTGWQGVWTGIRPVEWASVTVGGQERCYGFSQDGSGTVRIWEAFQANRADNGRRIPWLVETRTHAIQPSIFEYGTFRHFRIILDQIKGNLDIVGMWKGTKGIYHEVLTTSLTATPGSILTPLPQYTPIVATTDFQTFGMQNRTVISKNMLETSDCSSRDVESQFADSTDHAFSLALRFTGRGALVAYEIHADTQPDNTEGTGARPSGVDEQGFNVLPGDGCPFHEAGTTPDYVAAEEPIQLGVCPYVPARTLEFEYAAPVS